MAFDSKGFKGTGKRKLKELEEALEKVTRSGEVPVLCDLAPVHIAGSLNFQCIRMFMIRSELSTTSC